MEVDPRPHRIEFQNIYREFGCARTKPGFPVGNCKGPEPGPHSNSGLKPRLTVSFCIQPVCRAPMGQATWESRSIGSWTGWRNAGRAGVRSFPSRFRGVTYIVLALKQNEIPHSAVGREIFDQEGDRYPEPVEWARSGDSRIIQVRCLRNQGKLELYGGISNPLAPKSRGWVFHPGSRQKCPRGHFSAITH